MGNPMDDTFGSLSQGTSIDIQRSDGRVHAAVVVDLNGDSGMVTVEWFEKGDTKGKEIDVSQVKTLNPAFWNKPVERESNKPSKLPHKGKGNKAEEASVAPSPRGHDTTVSQAQQKAAPGRVATRNAHRKENVVPGHQNAAKTANEEAEVNWTVISGAKQPVNSAVNVTGAHGDELDESSIRSNGASRTKIPTTRRTGAMNKRGISRPNSVVYTEEEQQDVVAPPPVPVRGVAAVNNTIQNASSADQNTSNLPQKKILPGGGSLTVLQQQPPTQPPPPAQNTNTLNNVQSQQNNKDAANVRRKSNCVKEVERMEKEREQRRVNQQKKRDEKEQIMNKLNNDGNNPNWEFYKMIIEFQESLQYNPLQGNEAVADHQICVAVRKRPMSVKEKKKSEVDVLTIPDKQTLIVHEPKVKVDLTKFLENQTFRFDYSFDENVDNRMVYKYTAQPLVRSIFDGGMATCFAYGQTGSGKTHTMGGDFTGKTQDSTKGIYAYAAQDVFKLLESPKYAGLNLLVSCSFFEIYSAKVFDLINEKKRLQVLEDGKAEVHVKGLMEVVVNSVEDIMQLIHLGNSTRTSGTTSMNNHSSRSHAVFQIILRPSNQTSKLHGKLSLIDLAGNERGKDTISSDRGTRLEGAEINKSLLALKECIRALGKPGAHLPFRSSKLTQVLRDSFIGDNARTCMIAMIAPVFSSCEHTLNTLRYADRVKELGATDTAIMEEAELEVYDPDDPLNSPSPSRNGTGNPQEHGGKKGGDASKKRRSHNSSMGLLRNEDVEAKMMRTQDDEEIQEDWYAVMPLCDELREMEEKLLDNVRAHIENEMELSEQKRNLYNGTNNPDYDIDDFSAQMERMVDGQLDELLKIKEDLANIRLKIKQEEETAKQITTKKQSGKK